MTSLFDDDTLLVALSAALEPEDVEPGPHALAALDQALADRAGAAADHGLAIVVPIMAPARRSSTWAGLHRLRHPVAAAVAVGVLATSGVAAAGVATDRLPGPTRTVAYDLGLPVTSPALEGTRGTMDQLRQALAGHNVAQVNASAVFLRTQLAGLSPSDRAQVEPAAAELLAQADTFLRVAAAFGFPVGTPGQRSNGGTASTHGGSTPGPTEAGGTTPGTSGSSGSSSGGTTTGSGSPTTTGGPPETTPTTAPAGSTTTTTTTTGSTTTTTHPHRERDDGSDS